VNNNKQKGITLVVALIATASLFSLGAVAATTITPAYAGGDEHENDNGDGVKQKAEAEAECDQKNKVVDGRLNVQTNTQLIGCIAASINANDFEILSGGGMDFTTSENQFSALQ
jgi:hypothetical protein